MLLLRRSTDGGGSESAPVQCTDEGLIAGVVARDVPGVDRAANVEHPVRLPAGVDVAEAGRVRVAEHPLHAGIDELDLLRGQAHPRKDLDRGVKLWRNWRIPCAA